MKDIFIEPLKASDFEGVRKVDEETQRQYLGDEWGNLDIEEKEESLVSRKSEFELNVNTDFSFVARNGSEVIGFVFAYETFPFLGTINIRHIAIDPKFQGQGVGVLLFNKIIFVAKTRNIKKIISQINLDNPRSMKLHERVGFTLKNRKEAVIRLD